MAFVAADRVKETTTTTGTGSYTLSGVAASGGFRTFATGIVNGNQCDYCVTDGTSYEVGRGTLSAGTTLTRDLIVSSSTGAAISWAAGSKDIFATYSQKTAMDGGVDSVTGLTAAGSTQGTALLLTSSINFVSTTAAGTGVILPAGKAGDHTIIINHGANALLVYPATGETVEGGAANAPMTLQRGQQYEVACTSNGVWDGVDMNVWDDENSSFCINTHTSFPPAPNLGALSVFAKNVGGRPMLAQTAPLGLSTPFQPSFMHARPSWVASIGNTTSAPSSYLLLNPTTVGTLTARNIATTNIQTRTRRIGIVSAATAGSLSSFYFVAGAQQYCLGNGSSLGGFHHCVRFCVSDAAAVSGARQFIGWRNVVTAPTNIDQTTQTNAFGLCQLSTDATQWYMCYGGSAAQTAIALGTGLGAPTDVTTTWDVAFYAPPGSNNTVYYAVTNLGTGVQVTGTLTGTAGTALPASTTLLAPAMWRTNNATALAVGFDFATMYLETDV